VLCSSYIIQCKFEKKAICVKGEEFFLGGAPGGGGPIGTNKNLSKTQLFLLCSSYIIQYKCGKKAICVKGEEFFLVGPQGGGPIGTNKNLSKTQILMRIEINTHSR